MKIKLTDRYIYKELLTSFILILAALNMVVMMERVLKLSKLLANMGAGMTDFLEMIIFIQPQMLILTIPLSCMIAIIIIYSRMSHNNEITILRVTGMSLTEIARPALVFGIICFILGLITSFYLSEAGSKAFRLRFTQIFTQKAPLSINQGVFYTSFDNMVVFVGEKLSNNLMKDVFIYDNRRPNDPWIIYASNGELEFYENLKAGFILKNGRIFFTKQPKALLNEHQTDEKSILNPETGLKATTTFMTFQRYNISINITQPLNIQNSELTPFELLQRSKALNGIDRNSLLLEFHRRLTFPLTILALSIIAVPLAIKSSHSGQMAGSGIGLIIFGLYYGLLLYMEGLSEPGVIPHYIGGWLPVIILFVICGYFYNKEAKV